MDLSTDRLSIRILNDVDADLVVHYLNENKDFLIGVAPNKPSEFYMLKFQQAALKDNPSKRLIRFYLFKKENPNYVIGHIGISNIIRGPLQSCFIGFGMLGTELRKGYITEALAQVTNYVFEELNLHRIEANIMPRNLPSIGVIEKSGFEREGLRKQYLKINGVWEDHWCYVKLNDRWMDTQ